LSNTSTIWKMLTSQPEIRTRVCAGTEARISLNDLLARYGLAD